MLKLATSVLLAAAALTQAAVWQPATGTKFQIVLNSTIKISSTSPSVTPNVPVYDIDMFDNNSTNVIAALHKLNKKVICYFSAGSSENWRPDYNQIPTSAQGKALNGWPGEKWLNTKDTTVRKVMAARIKMAAQMGCDGVDPDNVDGFANDTGFTLSAADGTDFIKFLATTAASYNLAIGLKNAMDILSSVQSVIQFAVNEECAYYDECDKYAGFIGSKPVFQIEYWDDKQWLTNPCSQMRNNAGFSTVIKYRELDGRVKYCDGTSYTTSTN